jgi:hypothetical protein
MQGFPETCKLFQGFLQGKKVQKGYINASSKSNVGLITHLPKCELTVNPKATAI